MNGTDNTKVIISAIADIIVEHYAPQKIILFGSYVTGRQSEESDIDLLIVKDTDKRPIERWIEVKRIMRDLKLTIPVSPLVYTEKELEERRAVKDFFIEEILEKGEVLYG